MAPDDDGQAEGSQLNETVQTLSKMIRDLEQQLERMLEVNEALESDLEKEKQKTATSEQERRKLKDQLQQSEQELISSGDLRAEVSHLEQERSRLATTIEELGRQLADSERENRKLDRLAERMRAERNESVEELQSVEEQFDRAMEIVADLRTRLATLAEERDALNGRLKVMESQFQMAEDQRNSLRNEVDESRKALEEIRRSVSDVCVMSQRWYYQQEETE